MDPPRPRPRRPPPPASATAAAAAHSPSTAPPSSTVTQVSSFVVHIPAFKQTNRCKTENTAQEEDTTLAEMLKEAIKDIPDSMGETNIELEVVLAPGELARLIKEHFRKADLNSTPAAPSITQNHFNSQEAERWLAGDHRTDAELNWPYMRALNKTVPSNVQRTRGRASQPAQTGLQPQAYHPYTSQYVPQVSTEAFSSSWTLPQRPIPQQPSHQWYMEPQGFGNSRMNTTPALVQRPQSMQNRHISQNAQINQKVPIAWNPQMAQESQVHGQISQSYQSHRGNGPEFVNGPQQFGSRHPNRNLQQGHGFQQRIGTIQRSLAQGSQASQEGQDQNQSNGPEQDNNPQSRKEHP